MSKDIAFDSGLAAIWNEDKRTFEYGEQVFGPEPEYRRLDAIRPSLRDPKCEGPDPVYSIVMDVGRDEHRQELLRRKLLFGVVAYAKGRLGQEPVRSQGHVHAISPHSGWSAPELFEIWEGRAIVYAQQFVADDPGVCIAIDAGPGDHVVVPPGWAHCVINADPDSTMVFGAWCDREYGFAYDRIRARAGLAWYPLLDKDDRLYWQPNSLYSTSEVIRRTPRDYQALGVLKSLPIYEQFAQNPEALQWVSDPAQLANWWPSFLP